MTIVTVFLYSRTIEGGDLKVDPTSGIPITDLTLDNISGSDAVDSSGIALPLFVVAQHVWTGLGPTLMLSGARNMGATRMFLVVSRALDRARYAEFIGQWASTCQALR